MAFLRTEKKQSGTYLRIVESYRDKQGKSRHRALYNLGKAEDYSSKTLKKIGKLFLELSGESYSPEAPVKEISRFNYGFVQVYDKILRIYGLKKLLDRIGDRKKLSFDLYRHVLLMLIERLNDPASKLSNFNNKEEYLHLDSIELHNLYRSLDHLCDSQSQVQETIYHQGRDLFNQRLDVVFYDVTTFYFDSEYEDGFRNQGYSKDGKIGKTVIVFGLLIDADKNPIGYKIYRGGFYEGYTFADAVRKLKKEYMIEKVIMVADRGMMNKGNVEVVEKEAGYEYIIGERLKNLPEQLQKQLTDRSQYSTMEIKDPESGDKMHIEYLMLEYSGKRLLATYSSKRAAKDRWEREKRIEKGLEILKNPSKAEKKARRNYLTKTENDKYKLDEEKIEKDKRYDGIVCLATNNRQMGVPELLDTYKQLYKIEHSFRTFKSYLETRPMFHWTQSRIEGHLCLCYIAFTLLNYLRNTLAKKGHSLSENEIRKVVNKMQLSLVEKDGEEYYLRSNNSENERNILKSINLKEIPNLIKKTSVNDYISID